MSFVITSDFDFTGDNVIVAYSTNEYVIQIVDEAGDPFDLTPYEEVRAEFRNHSNEDQLPGSQASDVVYDADYSATNITPETHTGFVSPKTSGQIRVVIGAVETKLEQDGSARKSGLWDAVAYTTATGADESFQTKVAKGAWSTQWTSTLQTP
ncbi:MAG TPA: hypothetical protein VFG22_13230 [Polyangiales bacterium]|nr:hypothetical protein [Polyangiales bacterium]